MQPALISGPQGVLGVDDGGRGGLPVILLHSLAGSSAHWSGTLERLRPTQRAIALDLRGHGRSEPPKNGDYSIAGMAGDVEAVVDTLDIRKFILVGHSMGGGMALAYAGDHPDRIAGLLLVDPIGDGTQIPADEARTFLESLDASYDSMIQDYWSRIAGPNRTVRERLLSDLRAMPREAVVLVLHEVMRFDPGPALARYRGPILSVVTPSNDQAFSLHRVGKGFPHHIAEGTGHWIQLDKPEEFNRLLHDFVKTIKT